MKRFDLDSLKKRFSAITIDETALSNDIFSEISDMLTSELSRESGPYSASDWQPLFGKFKDDELKAALDEAFQYFG